MTRLSRELISLNQRPIPGAHVFPVNDCLTELQITLQQDSNILHCTVCIPSDYPISPPLVLLAAPLPHPNVIPRSNTNRYNATATDHAFEVCLDILSSPTKGTQAYSCWS